MPAAMLQVIQAAGALTLSTLALGWSIYTWRMNRQAEADKQAREGERRDDELLAWSSRAIEVMADIEALAEHDPAIWGPGGFDQRRVILGGAASALLDQGRAFFPNTENGEEVRRDAGLRAAILDELKVAHLVAEDIAATTPRRNASRAGELWQARAEFTSYLREIVGSKRRRYGLAADAGRQVSLEPLGTEAEVSRAKPP